MIVGRAGTAKRSWRQDWGRPPRRGIFGYTATTKFEKLTDPANPATFDKAPKLPWAGDHPATSRTAGAPGEWGATSGPTSALDNMAIYSRQLIHGDQPGFLIACR